MTDAGAFYWQHGDVIGIAIGIVAILTAQTVLVLWAVRRMAELTHMRERLSRLADGLALLTDTTEAGLATIARELQQQSKRPASSRASSRASVSKRVVAAARKGRQLSEIADQEALSESEVRLHLKLAEEEKVRSTTYDVRGTERRTETGYEAGSPQ